MVHSTTPQELVGMLRQGTVKFQFRKKDGSVRTAVGTLKESLITCERKGGENIVKPYGYQVYFDLEKNAFRCYNPGMVIGVEA